MSATDPNRTSWTDADFEDMGWHDCTIHGLRFDQDGEYQSDLVLDLDYIIEWLQIPGGAYQFQVAPAQLQFQNVDNLNIQVVLQYKQTVGINEIVRASSHWVIRLHGYAGQESSQVEFDASGYVQKLTRPPIIVRRQHLTRSERE